MRIAILGTRGIPARYGGFETFAEELSTAWWRAATRSPSIAASAIPSPPIAAFAWCISPPCATNISTPSSHTFLSTLHLIFHRADVALYCNGANAIFTVLAAPVRNSGTR